MMSHFETKNILDNKQGGFRKEHSTTNSTAKFVNDIYKAMHDGMITIAVFIDLRKAFDTVTRCYKRRKAEVYVTRSGM